MPSIKSLLRGCAASASTQCFDGDSSARIQISISQESTTYYPPSDGWVVVNANGTGIQTELFGDNLEILSVNNFGSWGRCSLPVKKGAKVTVNI